MCDSPSLLALVKACQNVALKSFRLTVWVGRGGVRCGVAWGSLFSLGGFWWTQRCGQTRRQHGCQNRRIFVAGFAFFVRPKTAPKKKPIYLRIKMVLNKLASFLASLLAPFLATMFVVFGHTLCCYCRTHVWRRSSPP
jgi:hypothetical protein